MQKKDADAMLAPCLQAPASLTPTQAARIGIVQCRLDDDQDMALARAWPVLSAAEAARAERFHFDRDRHRYVRGRGFLRQMLAQKTGQGAADLVLSDGARGKPALQDHALWFNLTHSRDLAVLAVSDDGPIGIDLEFVDRRVDSTGLAQTCMTPDEQQVLRALAKTSQVMRFFTFWTAKEARMKLTGEGMSLPPNQIVLDLQDGHPVGYLQPTSPVAQAIFVDVGHPGAVCCLAIEQGPYPAITPLVMTKGAHVTQ